MNTTTLQTIVIYGPQGCGKTQHAQALATHFSCLFIADEWDGVQPLPDGVLALTNVNPPENPTDTARWISFSDAMAQLA